jgi:sugar phosphate isomerase/epimerase
MLLLMRRVFPTQLFGRSRLTTALLDRMARVGVQEVELHCSLPHLNYRQRGQIEELGHWFRDSEMRVTALHTPVYYDESENVHAHVSIASSVKAERIKATDEIKRALEVADLIPCEFVVQHIGADGEEYSQESADAAFNALDELNVFVGQLGAELLIENGANDLSSAAKLNLLVGMTHLKNGFCFNVGAAHRSDGVVPEFEALRERIRMVHLSDNDGTNDSRLAPLLESGGTIDWGETVHMLGSLSADTPWGMDLSDDPKREKPVVLAADSFSRLEELLANE